MKKLTVQELKESNPGLYALCIQEGVKQERKRCVNLLPKRVKDESARYAIQCVKDGSAMGDLQKAKYMTMQIDKQRRVMQKAKNSETVASLVEFKVGVNRNEPDYH